MTNLIMLLLVLLLSSQNIVSNQVFYDKVSVFHTIMMNDEQLKQYNMGNEYKQAIFKRFNILDTDQGRALITLALFEFGNIPVDVADFLGFSVIDYAEKNKHQFPILYKVLKHSVMRGYCIEKYYENMNVNAIYDTRFIEAVVYLTEITPCLLANSPHKSLKEIQADFLDAEPTNFRISKSNYADIFFSWFVPHQ